MVIKIGVIAEGITDHIVYEKFISEFFKDKDFELHFIKEQPGDATSSTIGGGWTEVKKWCLRNSPTFRNTLLTQGLFKGASTRDILLFHIDSDIAQKIMANAQETGHDLSSPLKRGAYVNRKLIEWLWPDQNNPDMDKHVIAPAVDSTETWMVCAIDNNLNIEAISNQDKELETILANLIRDNNIHNLQAGARSLPKKPSRYNDVCDKIKKDVSTVYANCSYFKKTCDDLEVQINQILDPVA